MHYQTLAEKEGLGKVVICDGCQDVHVAIDTVTLRITQDAFVSLAEMIQTSLKHPKLSLGQKDPRSFMGAQLFSLA